MVVVRSNDRTPPRGAPWITLRTVKNSGVHLEHETQFCSFSFFPFYISTFLSFPFVSFLYPPSDLGLFLWELGAFNVSSAHTANYTVLQEFLLSFFLILSFFSCSADSVHHSICCLGANRFSLFGGWRVEGAIITILPYPEEMSFRWWASVVLYGRNAIALPWAIMRARPDSIMNPRVARVTQNALSF